MAPLPIATDTLPVVETFHSLQGEGIHAGRSAFFIRLAGCTVGCRWCDTKHSWPEATHPTQSLQDLADQAQAAAAAGAAFAVITGGEPLITISPTSALHSNQQTCLFIWRPAAWTP